MMKTTQHITAVRPWLLIYCFCSLTWLISACQDEISTSATDQPAFSTDTLHLGTILADNSSSTFQVMLYNRGSKDLRLSSIGLRNAETSGFRINVDGMNGSTFTQTDLLRIAAHDSMYIFVEATFAASGEGVKQHIDYIDCICNGRTQSVVLEATGKDVLKVVGETFSESRTFIHGQDVQVYDSLVVAPGVTLTLEDSVTIFLHDKACMIVYGTLLCQGSATAPVVIRGDRTDKMFDNLPYDNLPSQWGSLCIKGSSAGNVWRHTEVRGMTDGIRIDSADVETSRLIVESCRIKNSGGPLLYARMANVTLHNSELSNAAGSLLELYGGNYDITHCTLANYNFAAAIKQEAIYLSNFDSITWTLNPLYRCDFNNTIIWGDTYDPDVFPDFYWFVDAETGEKSDSIFNYRFDHCLLHADGTDDKDFINTIWNQNPKFTLIDDANYTYDFRLGDDSPAIATGSADYVTTCPTDLDGKPRPTAGNPSIGCYEKH